MSFPPSPSHRDTEERLHMSRHTLLTAAHPAVRLRPRDDTRLALPTVSMSGAIAQTSSEAEVYATIAPWREYDPPSTATMSSLPLGEG